MKRHEIVQVELSAPDTEGLFQSLDPSPLPERRLDPDVADYISDRLGHGGGYRRRARLIVHAGRLPTDMDDEQVAGALRHAFALEQEHARQRFHQLMIEGRRSLLISVAFILLCLAAALAVWKSVDEVPLLVGSTLSIAAWVVLWRPIEIFFYDWWPLRAEGRMWHDLMSAPIDFRSVASVPEGRSTRAVPTP